MVAAAVTASVGVVGGDLRWLAAVGHTTWSSGSIPKGVPYATALSVHWVNVPVGSELVLAAGGSRFWLAAQVAAVAAALWLVACDARRHGAEDAAAAGSMIAVLVGASTAFLVIRAQLFSLALFPLLVYVLRREARAPSRRIWLLVPLLAIWANLHGAVLVGVAVAACYLLLSRARRDPLTALGVFAALPLAVCATPALWRTPTYYRDVAQSEAAHMGVELWASLSPTHPFDIVYAAAAVLLLAAAWRARPQVWEIVALVALAALSVHVARGGVWLLLMAAPLAAQGLSRWGPAGSRSRLAAPLLAASVVLVVVGVVRGPAEGGAGTRLLADALREARGTPILADGPIAEQVALARGKVWLGNPLDAFSRADQRVYLDWLAGKPAGDAALPHAARVVLVLEGSVAERRMATLAGWRLGGRDAHAALYERR